MYTTQHDILTHNPYTRIHSQTPTQQHQSGYSYPSASCAFGIPSPVTPTYLHPGDGRQPVRSPYQALPAVQNWSVTPSQRQQSAYTHPQQVADTTDVSIGNEKGLHPNSIDNYLIKRIQGALAESNQEQAQLSLNRGTKRELSPSNILANLPAVAPGLRYAHIPGYSPYVDYEPSQFEMQHAHYHSYDYPPPTPQRYASAQAPSQLNPMSASSPAEYISVQPMLQPNPDSTGISPRHMLAHTAPEAMSINPYPNFTSGFTSTLFPPRPPLDWDEYDQRIVTDYNQYRWPVKLYRINVEKTGYQFAMLWLEDQLDALDFNNVYKWHQHITDGFIEGSDHLTFIVLHNAADPFLWDTPTPSTSSFCYHESSADSITWKTITPSLRSTVDRWVAEDLVTEVRRWTLSMSPRDKRFHKGYWTAANMLPLKSLLNRRDADDTKVRLPISGNDSPISIHESDVNNDGIDISPQESWALWRKIKEEIRKDLLPRSEHVVIRCCVEDTF